ncbi:hypothetical protein LQ384_28695 [Rhodococcus rhodochrous]|uniref:Uncharacterized protein n=1 Tax=Rhodococcus rhodochrous TaxID=1829 RepID=A0AAW4XPF1_RHORH|nr:hypothetical protein [Rhodococcus rhodochrous]MCD2115055.1 hypothetical protein [Rhodococcus rhodochrous]
MCKPKPGPRCTPHMRARLTKAAARTEVARTRLADNPTHPRLQQRLTAAEADHAQTLVLYDATPGGQSELRAAIATTADPTTRHALTERLRDAEKLRAEQTDALRRTRAGQTHQEGTGDAQRGTDDTGTQRSILENLRVEPGPTGSRADRDRDPLDRSEDRGSRSPRLLISGQQIRPVATHNLSASVCAGFEARRLSAPPLHELSPTDVGIYRDQMLELARKNPYAASVYVYDEHEYRQMRLLVTDDGKAGVALKGDEIVSAFAHKDCAHPRAARAMLRHTTALGGRRLDCFDTVLPDLYADAGFVPVARLRWNDDYAPDGWDYDTFRAFNHGRPDVVFMAYDPEHVGGKYARGTGEYVDDYDDGIVRAQKYRPR